MQASIIRKLVGTALLLVTVCLSAYFGIRSMLHPLDPRLVKADNEFGFRLFRQLLRENPDRNIVISPVGVALAMQLVYNGASGETKRQMAKTLGIEDISVRDLNRMNRKLMAVLSDPNLGLGVDVENSLSAGKGIRFKPDFLAVSSRYYKAELLNSTSGRKGGLSLTSQSRFRGQWMYILNKSIFERVAIRHGGREINAKAIGTFGVFNLRANKTEGVDIIQLPYSDAGVSMYLFDCFPKQILGSQSWTVWERWISQMQKTVVMVCIPIFRIQSTTDLGSSLSPLGIDLSSRTARDDLGNMCSQPCNIRGMEHSAFVQAQEGGSRPAPKRTSPFPEVYIVQDPTFFVIRDDRTGLILFMGWVADPTEGLKPSD